MVVEQFANYLDVPWYRRSGNVSILVLAGFFCVPPLLWSACILCLTGEIYNKKVGVDGYLTRWSYANKIVAGIILIVQSVALAARFYGFPRG